jgi:hypothetical protein
MSKQVPCTCPACCPDKWALNRMSQAHLHGVLTQTGLASDKPETAGLAQILARLERIEAILHAHVQSVQPAGE